eukprot:CAMPEP_0172454118 /NCGR_PEP_ID=MMETSP1065-20121228/11196_1 /TAXON_ID=265537 /ORGANISM="Amphiprora paludosa, Strain CCMP125" /LENGTH=532 /DNA_ID=CAMNT_0013206395 /DNA_START=205 /DNA_END=1803 /DNA_ORIENTATION=-
MANDPTAITSGTAITRYECTEVLQLNHGYLASTQLDFTYEMQYPCAMTDQDGIDMIEETLLHRAKTKYMTGDRVCVKPHSPWFAAIDTAPEDLVLAGQACTHFDTGCCALVQGSMTFMELVVGQDQWPDIADWLEDQFTIAATWPSGYSTQFGEIQVVNLGLPPPPTRSPSLNPTKAPTTTSPSNHPTERPVTSLPTEWPTSSPTTKPTTASPTTVSPTTMFPTRLPTEGPATSPPTERPVTSLPTKGPTSNPTVKPTTTAPTTVSPTTKFPTQSPTQDPTTTRPSTLSPTQVPTNSPVESLVENQVTAPPTPSSSPVVQPSASPTLPPSTLFPTFRPTPSPSALPTQAPTNLPTFNPVVVSQSEQKTFAGATSPDPVTNNSSSGSQFSTLGICLLALLGVSVLGIAGLMFKVCRDKRKRSGKEVDQWSDEDGNGNGLEGRFADYNDYEKDEENYLQPRHYPRSAGANHDYYEPRRLPNSGRNEQMQVTIPSDFANYFKIRSLSPVSYEGPRENIVVSYSQQEEPTMCCNAA